MTETLNRFFVSLFMIAVLFGALWLEKAGLHGVYALCMVVGAGMILEFLACLWRAPRDVMFNGKNLLMFAVFLGLLIVDFTALRFLGTKIMTLLLLVMVICAADIGAWFFGRLLGGDKMWERISEHKTWAGQVFGIICGTVAAVAYGYIVRHTYMPQMIWLGIGISLLSQYGDLTASFVKRKLGIKDFSHILGKHGGILDRFDGWVYVLPLVWLMMA